MTEQQFHCATELAKNVFKKNNKELSNDELLILYGWYKQATVGDNKTEQPGYFSFKEKAKWAAWGKCAGKSPEQARAQYIAALKDLLVKYQLQESLKDLK